MGGNTSKKHENTTQSQPSERLHSSDGVRRVLLIHHSNSKEQKKAVHNFRDSLLQAAPGRIKIAKLINIAEENYKLEDASWLENVNNVILIRLTPEDISSLVKSVREKGYLDENNTLHGRVIAVAFGKTIPSGWPPMGTKRQSLDQKDFCLELENEEDVFAVEDSKISSLVSAIMASE